MPKTSPTKKVINIARISGTISVLFSILSLLYPIISNKVEGSTEIIERKESAKEGLVQAVANNLTNGIQLEWETISNLVKSQIVEDGRTYLLSALEIVNEAQRVLFTDIDLDHTKTKGYEQYFKEVRSGLSKNIKTDSDTLKWSIDDTDDTTFIHINFREYYTNRINKEKWYQKITSDAYIKKVKFLGQIVGVKNHLLGIYYYVHFAIGFTFILLSLILQIFLWNYTQNLDNLLLMRHKNRSIKLVTILFVISYLTMFSTVITEFIFIYNL